MAGKRAVDARMELDDRKMVDCSIWSAYGSHEAQEWDDWVGRIVSRVKDGDLKQLMYAIGLKPNKKSLRALLAKTTLAAPLVRIAILKYLAERSGMETVFGELLARSEGDEVGDLKEKHLRMCYEALRAFMWAIPAPARQLQSGELIPVGMVPVLGLASMRRHLPCVWNVLGNVLDVCEVRGGSHLQTCPPSFDPTRRVMDAKDTAEAYVFGARRLDRDWSASTRILMVVVQIPKKVPHFSEDEPGYGVKFGCLDPGHSLLPAQCTWSPVEDGVNASLTGAELGRTLEGCSLRFPVGFRADFVGGYTLSVAYRPEVMPVQGVADVTTHLCLAMGAELNTGPRKVMKMPLAQSLEHATELTRRSILRVTPTFNHTTDPFFAGDPTAGGPEKMSVKSDHYVCAMLVRATPTTVPSALARLCSANIARPDVALVASQLSRGWHVRAADGSTFPALRTDVRDWSPGTVRPARKSWWPVPDSSLGSATRALFGLRAEGAVLEPRGVRADDDIETLSNIVLLRDRLGARNVTIPVRGISCDHLYWFDLTTFLQFSMSHLNLASAGALPTKGFRWKCPYCKSVIGPSELRIDPLPLAILERAHRLGEGSGSIEKVLEGYEPRLLIQHTSDAPPTWTVLRQPLEDRVHQIIGIPEEPVTLQNSRYANSPSISKEPVTGTIKAIELFPEGTYTVVLHESDSVDASAILSSSGAAAAPASSSKSSSLKKSKSSSSSTTSSTSKKQSSGAFETIPLTPFPSSLPSIAVPPFSAGSKRPPPPRTTRRGPRKRPKQKQSDEEDEEEDEEEDQDEEEEQEQEEEEQEQEEEEEEIIVLSSDSE